MLVVGAMHNDCDSASAGVAPDAAHLLLPQLLSGEHSALSSFFIHAFTLARFVFDRFDDCRDMVRNYFPQGSPHAMIKDAVDGQIAPAGSHSPENEEPQPTTMKSPPPTSIL